MLMRIKYVKAYQANKTGQWRYEFRRRGHAANGTRLPGEPGSVEFTTKWAECMAGGVVDNSKPSVKALQTGTINHAITCYYASLEFQDLRESTKRSRRNVIERFRSTYGSYPLNTLQPKHIRAIVSKLAEKKPGAADGLLKRIRAILRAAVNAGLVESNAARDVDGPKREVNERHSWTDEERAQFEARHPLGTRARTAYALLLGTGQRRSDIVRMGPQMVSKGQIRFLQEKTRKNHRWLEVPLVEPLREALAAYPCGDLSFLVTAYGAPMTANGFGNWFADMCRAAGLPDRCRAHGLRKAAGALLAEAGCTSHEIMSVLGISLKMAELYTRAANQKRMAKAAMKKLHGNGA